MKDLKIIKDNKGNKRIHIALVGHMGSGKSLIGKLIAKELNIDYLDSDKIIEKATGKKINAIFNEDGENFFRLTEEKSILNLNLNKRTVLSLGGGSILSEKTRKMLKDKFITVFLDANIDILVERLKKSSKRPLLIGENIQKKIKELDFIRRKYYLLSDIIITNNKNTIETLSIFKSKYKKINEKNN